MKLEINKNQLPDESTFKFGNRVFMFTPPIGRDDFWLFRVKLSKDQAIIGFPKFSCIGIGFFKEKDWNTNLPSNCKPERIFEHIRDNKGDDSISDDDCIKAIKIIKDAAKKYLNSLGKEVREI